jgi:zinc protease
MHILENKKFMENLMKKNILIVVLVLVIGLLNANNLVQKTLPNGMQIVAKENRLNESVGFYCFVKTGSVNEGKYLGAGISHYLEHIVSGGATKFRTEDEYTALGKEMGALVNAYTTNVITAFHIEVSNQYKDTALEVISEQLTSCICDSFEVSREKQVILKEIVMRSTPPTSKMYQRHNELVYPNSNSRYPVIGYTNLYKTITRDELEDYYKQRYAPNNMIFVAVGDFNAEDMLTQLEETFKDFERIQIEPATLPVQNKRNGSIEYVEEFEIEQPTTFVSTIIPASDYSDVPALSMAIDILFGKRKSPIRYKLVEELKLVNYIYGYADGTASDPNGSLGIIFEAKDPGKVKEIVSIIDAEIEKFSKSGITQEQIQNVINREKAERLLRTPSIGSDANRIGWSLLRYGVADYYPINLQIMEKLTPQKLQAAMKKHFVPKDRIIFYAVPVGTKSLMESSESVITEKTEVEKIEMNNDLTLLYKKSSDKPFVQGVIHLPISTDYETIETAGTLRFLMQMMFSGSKKYDPLDITEWFEDHAVSFEVSTNMRGTLIEFKCLKDDYPKLADIIVNAFQNPIFEESELQLFQEQTEANYKRSLSRPNNWHRDFMSATLYPGTKFGLSSEDRMNNVLELTRDDLKQMYKTFVKSQSAIITLVGDIDREEAISYSQDLYRAVSHKKINEEKQILEVPELSETFVNPYKFEQVNVALNMKAPSMNDNDALAMRVINLIFNGSRGRLHQALRGTNDLAYYGYSDYSYDDNYGYVRLISQTSIDKKDELISVLQNEIDRMINEPVKQEDINSAIEENRKMMDAYLNDNRLAYYITMYEARGLGYDYLKRSSDLLKTVTPQDIKKVAQKYFNNVAVLVSQPSDDVELMVE